MLRKPLSPKRNLLVNWSLHSLCVCVYLKSHKAKGVRGGGRMLDLSRQSFWGVVYCC